MKKSVETAIEVLNSKCTRDDISRALVGLSKNIRTLYPDESQKHIRNMLLRFELIQLPSQRYSHMKKEELKTMLATAVKAAPNSLTL